MEYTRTPVRQKLLWIALVCVLGLCRLPADGQAARQSVKVCKRRPLRVVVYPFIPRFKGTLYYIKTQFETDNPGIELKVVDLSANYYAAIDKTGKPAKHFVGTTSADVFELDSVFLQDFVRDKKIQPLPHAALIPDSELLKNAIAGATVNGTRYGSPHWVCGNFIFFSTGDQPIQGVHTLKDLESALGTAPPTGVDNGLATDLKGNSTLGEFYLEAAVDQYGWPAASGHVGTVEQPIEASLTRLFKLCTPGLCRDYHDTEVYARAFARRKARVLIGYSEGLNSVLSETAQGCTASDKCLKDSDLDVVQLSLNDSAAHQISWVDSYVVSRTCTGECLKDAASFIQFMNRPATYKAILQPGEYDLPGYLLPAQSAIYDDADVAKPAHLYPKLRSIIENAATPSSEGLNEQLRADGKVVDDDLNK